MDATLPLRPITSSEKAQLLGRNADFIFLDTDRTLKHRQCDSNGVATDVHLGDEAIDSLDVLTTTNTATATNKTLTAPTLSAGTTSAPSMTLVDGSLLTNQSIGALEYATHLYFTPRASTRSFVPLQQIYTLVSDSNVSAGTSIGASGFSWIPAPNDRINVVAGKSYRIQYCVIFFAAAANTHSISAGLTENSATAVLTTHTAVYLSCKMAAAASNTPVSTWTSSSSYFTVTSNNTNQYSYIRGDIFITVNSSGNIVPAARFSANAGEVTIKAGSYFTMVEIPTTAIGYWTS